MEVCALVASLCSNLFCWTGRRKLRLRREGGRAAFKLAEKLGYEGDYEHHWGRLVSKRLLEVKGLTSAMIPEHFEYAGLDWHICEHVSPLLLKSR
jgi:hypothetical protein